MGCIFSLHNNLFYLFWYSLISIHSVEKNSTITAVVVIPNTLWLNAPMFNTYDVGQMWHWWGPLQTTFVFHQLHNLTDWCASHLVRWKHSWIVTPRSAWSAIPPHAAACEMTCKFISYPYPLTIFVYNGCLSKLCHDGCDGKKSGDQTCTI